MKREIVIIDYRMGNLRSVQKSFEHAGVEHVVVSDDPARVAQASGIVLPGVGAFRDAVSNLQRSGIEPVMRERIAAGIPFLGICLGMQLLADAGYEDGEWRGLGLIPGVCRRLPATVKVPHIGWNTVDYPRDSALFAGIAPATAFYFVHGYHLDPVDASQVIGRTDYGLAFASAVQRDNVYAVQFHPEKSSTMGLKLLANFDRVVEESESC